MSAGNGNIERMRKEYLERREKDPAIRWFQVDCFMKALSSQVPGSTETVESILMNAMNKDAPFKLDEYEAHITNFFRDALIKAANNASK